MNGRRADLGLSPCRPSPAPGWCPLLAEPAASPPCQLAASPAWHRRPARSCPHMPSAELGPAPVLSTCAKERSLTPPTPSLAPHVTLCSRTHDGFPARSGAAAPSTRHARGWAAWIQPAPLPLPREPQHLRLRPGWWVFGRRARRRLSALYLCQAGGSETLLVPAGHGWTPVVAGAAGGAARG